MNHSNKLLDDALITLPKIRETLQLRANGAEWAALSEETREVRLKELRENEQMVQSSLLLANQTLDMLSFLTGHIHEPFLCNELVARLAGLLMSTITRLSGRRGVELKVGVACLV